MHGVVNEHLLPISPLTIRNKDGEWQDVNLLLDTGFDRELALDAALLSRYNLATHPDHQWLTPEEALKNHDNWGPRAPYTGELEWQGRERAAGIRVVAKHSLNGMLGTKLLMYHRLTVDVLKGGAVTIKSGPSLSSRAVTPWWSPRTQREKPFRGNVEQYLTWSRSYLPWTKLQVQDSGGKFNPIWVNVDTGDSQELSLPLHMVDRLGLKATGNCWIHTTAGLVETKQGGVNVIWQGQKCPVLCTHRPDDKPPLVGMKMLKGTRITVEFDLPVPIVEIRHILRSAPSVRGLLHSLGGHFRRRGTQ